MPASEESKHRARFLALFPLVHPPYSEMLPHDKKFQRVEQYLNDSPAVPQPHETTKKLFRAAKQCGPPDEDDLCHCILRRHFESYLGRSELVECRECSALSKPINIDWLVIPKEEREIRRRLQRKIGRARRIVEKKTNEEVNAKERARNTARLRRRRVKRKAERNTII
ncbi:hypothetical protein C8F04DRAFT_1184266 [Mycena alexandri]|uniref:Uncharacterized protein n=1 Tax=Mycena alexandri TaxID=1745969 RepID=A0AAD6STA6_9AGAR|nr:hypothetical protein C8F04DRAFT_1184266 [Mycena alexandri]